jgi:putative ABC transport system ATP-binding protein
MIKLGNVTKRYAGKGGMLLALDHVNLDVSKGEWVNICGGPRSGKTTILKGLMGLIRMDYGEINVSGHLLTSLPREQLKKYRQEMIGYVSKNSELLPQYNVIENVILPLVPFKRKSVIQERADYLLERLGIIHHRGHLPSRLSEDEKRLASLARALMNNPPIILLDEPLEGLEGKSREHILDIIKELYRNQHTIVNVTKDEGDLTLGDRTYLLQNGKLEEAVLI